MSPATIHIAPSKHLSTKQNPSLEWITDDLTNIIAQAFRDGETKGKKKMMDEMVEKYKKEYLVAMEVYKQFYDVLWAAKIKCKSIHVRFGSLHCFEAIFVIPTKDYFSDGYAKALSLSKTFKHPSQNITLNYRLMPFSKTINYTVLESDGFLTSYGI